jgi:uncharacterized protein YtpQ (UPF0354 family)
MSFFKKLFGKGLQVDKNSHAKDSIIETHRNKIYPWIKVFWNGDDDPRNTPIQIELKGEDSPIKKDWLGDLGILYVADMGNSFQVLLERDLPKGMSKEELHQLAVDNLNRDIEFKLHDTDFGGYMLVAGGDHEAGSICLPGMWDWLTEHLNDNVIVGIPAKDLVIMVPESDTDKIANLKIFVHEIFKNGERLLTKNILKFDKQTKDWTIVDSVT